MFIIHVGRVKYVTGELQVKYAGFSAVRLYRCSQALQGVIPIKDIEKSEFSGIRIVILSLMALPPYSEDKIQAKSIRLKL